MAEAAALLAEVERRLNAPCLMERRPMAPSLAAMATSLGLRLPRHTATHAMALDPQRLVWATAGSLYPDHVIFLGPSATALPADSVAAAVTVAQSHGRKLFLVPGHGALLSPATTASADELALCLALVLELSLIHI